MQRKMSSGGASGCRGGHPPGDRVLGDSPVAVRRLSIQLHFDDLVLLMKKLDKNPGPGEPPVALRHCKD